jgi:hypothetical protein
VRINYRTPAVISIGREGNVRSANGLIDLQVSANPPVHSLNMRAKILGSDFGAREELPRTACQK